APASALDGLGRPYRRGPLPGRDGPEEERRDGSGEARRPPRARPDRRLRLEPRRQPQADPRLSRGPDPADENLVAGRSSVPIPDRFAVRNPGATETPRGGDPRRDRLRPPSRRAGLPGPGLGAAFDRRRDQRVPLEGGLQLPSRPLRDPFPSGETEVPASERIEDDVSDAGRRDPGTDGELRQSVLRASSSRRRGLHF